MRPLFALTVLTGLATIFWLMTASAEAAGDFQADGRRFPTLREALAAVRPGGLVQLPAREIGEAAIVRTPDVTIRGQPGSHFRGLAAEGKAAIVVKAPNVTLEGFECSGIAVPDRNGACVRAEGGDLTLRRVHFRDSEQGLFGSARNARIVVEDSLFERLGKDGHAHGIHVNDGALVVRRSRVLSGTGQGHEIKSRARETVIEDSVVASLDGNDSRLIDLPNGGDVTIRRSVLQEGPLSANLDAISYGVEGFHDYRHRFRLIDSVVLMERIGRSRLLNMAAGAPIPIMQDNVLVGIGAAIHANAQNRYYADRRSAGMPPEPWLPEPGWTPSDN